MSNDVILSNTSNRYFYLDGVDDYIELKDVLWDSVRFRTMFFEDSLGSLTDSSDTWTGSLVTIGNGKYLFPRITDWNHYIDGLEISYDDALANNTLIIAGKMTDIYLEYDLATPIAQSHRFRAFRNRSTQFLKALAFEITLYHQGDIVANYDLSSGSLEDQSGNGNDATLNGGTWIQEIVNLRETQEDDKATISWNYPSSEGISHVNVYLDGDLVGENITEDYFELDSLSLGTSYEIRVSTNTYGIESLGNTIIVTMGAELVTNQPIVNVLSADRVRLSNKLGMDKSNLVFKFGFDQDIQAWEARVSGVDNTTGTLADSGGPAEAGSEMIAEISWEDLQQEGENRINIYGQGLDGSWTPYDDDRDVEVDGLPSTKGS